MGSASEEGLSIISATLATFTTIGATMEPRSPP
jgi:hypothetical protein